MTFKIAIYINLNIQLLRAKIDYCYNLTKHETNMIELNLIIISTTIYRSGVKGLNTWKILYKIV